MAEAFKCDRCGEMTQGRSKADLINNRGIEVDSQDLKRMGSRAKTVEEDDMLELCEKCADSFKLWWLSSPGSHIQQMAHSAWLEKVRLELLEFIPLYDPAAGQPFRITAKNEEFVGRLNSYLDVVARYFNIHLEGARVDDTEADKA